MRNLANLRGQFAAELTRDEMKHIGGGGGMEALSKKYCDNMPCPLDPPADWEDNPQFCSVFNSQKKGTCGYAGVSWGCVATIPC